MVKFTATEYDLNAIADLLNEIKDKDGALLRPAEKTFKAAWEASQRIGEAKRSVKGWEIMFKNGQKESFASYSVALGYAKQFGLSEPVEVNL